MTSSVHTSSVHDDVRTLNASDSDSLPSLANSLQNLTNSKQSVGSGGSGGSGAGSQQPPQSPDPEQFIAELLEKAKFYTSLCLGEFCGNELISKMVVN